jgi:hypothetical protein
MAIFARKALLLGGCTLVPMQARLENDQKIRCRTRNRGELTRARALQRNHSWSGLIGAAAARRLAPHFDVVGLDGKPPERLEPMKEHVHVDLTKDDSVQTALRHVRTAYGDRLASVIHLAAYYDFSGEPSPRCEGVTIRGTEPQLRGARNTFVKRPAWTRRSPRARKAHVKGKRGRRRICGVVRCRAWDARRRRRAVSKSRERIELPLRHGQCRALQ